MRPVTTALEYQDLVLAAANGSSAQPYTQLHFGVFAGWAPDGNALYGLARVQSELVEND